MTTTDNNTMKADSSTKIKSTLFDRDHQTAIINPESTSLDRVDAIQKRLTQSRTLINCLIDLELTENNSQVDGIIWMLSDKIIEIGSLVSSDWELRQDK